MRIPSENGAAGPLKYWLAKVKTVAAVSILAGSAMLFSTASAIAVVPFGAPEQISNCGGGLAIHADIDDDGVVHGFHGCAGSGHFGVDADADIKYFSSTSGSPVSWRTTAYHGRAVAAAWDGAGSLYLLYRQADALKLGSRTPRGQYTAPITLATGIIEGDTDGDLVAAAGQWGAVWARSVTRGGLSTSQIFQAGPLLGKGISQITTALGRQNNSWPALAHENGRTTLVFTRSAGAPLVAPSDLVVARTTGTGWKPVTFGSAGVHNLRPDVAMSGGYTYLAWHRDGRTVEADNESGAFVEYTNIFTPNVAGAATRISVSGGTVTVGWSMGNSGGTPLMVMQRDAAGWTTDAVPDGGGMNELLSHQGKATLLSAPEPGYVIRLSQS